jgi:MYXO-CTERM domain-containing protein
MFRSVLGGSRFGDLTLGLAICASLGACASSPEETDDAPGAVQGELQAISVLGVPNGQRSMFYSLRLPGSDEDIELIFDRDPNLTSKTTLRVWGAEQGEAFHVTRYRVIEPETDPELDRLALIGQPAVQRRVAWVQMNINGGGVNQTVAQANQLIFERTAPGPLFGETHNATRNDKTLSQYYDEVTYGMLSLQGQVEGPLAYSGNVCPDNFNGPADAMRNQITQMGRTYDHYYLYWGQDQMCGTGWGEQGRKNTPGRYVWLNNSTWCAATAQEIGHNFGMMHASTTDCGSNILSNDMSGCTSSEYGSQITVMGGGCRHLNAIEKWYEGWLLQCNGVRVTSSATFTLFPIEIPCNGIQVLQIPFPSGAPTRQTRTDQSGNTPITLRNYYLELRASTGLDTGMTPGVYVHVAGDVPGPSSNGPRTFLLDMVPSSQAFNPMTAGQMYSDPAGGVSFTVNSFDANSASVTVTVSTTGGNTCIGGGALQGTGPTTCGSGGMGGMGGMGGAGGAGAGGKAGAGGAGGKGGAGGAGGGAGTTGGGAGGVAGATAGSGGAAGGFAGGAGIAGGGAGGLAGGGAGGASGGAAGAAGAVIGGAAGAAGASAGAGGAAAGAAGAAGTSTSGSAGAAPTGGAAGAGVILPTGNGVAEDEPGCGCRVAGGSESTPVRRAGSLAFVALALGAMIGRRRKRR